MYGPKHRSNTPTEPRQKAIMKLYDGIIKNTLHLNNSDTKDGYFFSLVDHSQVKANYITNELQLQLDDLCLGRIQHGCKRLSQSESHQLRFHSHQNRLALL